MKKRYTTPHEIEGTRNVTYHDYQVIDKKGRAMGAAITTYEVEFTLKPAAADSGYDIEAGHYFVFVPHTTRDGKPYGPVQPWQLSATVEERDAKVATYLRAANARALKAGTSTAPSAEQADQAEQAAEQAAEPVPQAEPEAATEQVEPPADEAPATAKTFTYAANNREIHILNEFVDNYEVKNLDANNENMVRVFPNLHNPHPGKSSITIQYRTHKPITDKMTRVRHARKPRNMIAHANFTIEELEEIVAWAKEYFDEKHIPSK